MKKVLVVVFLAFTKVVVAEGYDVFSIGFYDVKFDGGSTDEAFDFRYERRFDKS